ncbi:hypothetical protein An12g04580 [Aspergillus niger]|uniref:Uncharacterized protein n=2 Tax=Aspergillus niger TaxID=5061 RepID=A2QZD8_ASPNC|nr:hypothetical protein An12g04580 [Aspergillus niger]CAK97148.1 hypothetical protein An12g04580 [Aspergillus niger]
MRIEKQYKPVYASYYSTGKNARQHERDVYPHHQSNQYIHIAQFSLVLRTLSSLLSYQPDRQSTAGSTHTARNLLAPQHHSILSYLFPQTETNCCTSLSSKWILNRHRKRFITESTSHTSTAVETYQLDVESTALVRAAEDILALTRTMKETWLFGKLDTLGEDEADVKRREELEMNAEAIQKAIEDGGFLKAAKMPPKLQLDRSISGR